MRFKSIFTIFKKDAFDGAKNHHVILMLITPIILSLIFTNLLSKSKAKTVLPTIGIICRTEQPYIKNLMKKGFAKKVVFFANKDELESKILMGDVSFGLILPILSKNNKLSNNSEIQILYSPQYPDYSIETIKNSFEKEIMQFLNIKPPQLPFSIILHKLKASSSSANTFGTSMLPMLILMSMGMIGFIALPLSFVEEKEKGTLNALMLTPLSTSELILGKTIFSLCLIFITVSLILLLNNRMTGNLGFLFTFVLLGSLTSIFVGLAISAITKSQASVNAIGTTLFLFFQLIPNLQKSSDSIKSIAAFFPSTYINSGIKKAMFMQLSKVDIHTDLYATIVITFLAYFTAYLCLRIKSVQS